jgi:phenylalanyl-tRNA synthetase beta chain
MPTAEFPTGDFMRLVGKKVPLKELEERAAMLGTSVEEVTEEKIVVEVFPNRPDMLSVEGFARAYKTFTGLGDGLREYKVQDSGISLKTDDLIRGVRPFIIAAVVKNLPMTDDILLSIINMQEALHGSHGRKRAKVAIGIHDFNKTLPPYRYTAAKPSDVSFVPLDFGEEMIAGEVLEKHPKGKDYGHILEGKKGLPFVMDQKGVVSLPPVINADRTRVTEKTSNLFIEMTGTNELSLKHALNIVLSSLADRGGQIISVDINGKELDLAAGKMKLDTAYASRLLGLDLEPADIKRLLEKMGYGVESLGAASLEVLIPCYRADVLHPIDLVEDIAIAYGYGNFEPMEAKIPTIGKPDCLEESVFGLKMLMLGLGFQETVPFTLTNPAALEKARLSANPVKIKNPRTEDFTIMRTSAIASILGTLAYNKKKKLPQRIFEVDDVVPGRKDWENRKRLGIAILDNSVNFSDMQSVIEALLRGLGIDYKLKEDGGSVFIKGRCGEITIGNKRAGVFGEVHPEVLESFGLEYPAVIAEIFVESLFQ